MLRSDDCKRLCGAAFVFMAGLCLQFGCNLPARPPADPMAANPMTGGSTASIAKDHRKLIFPERLDRAYTLVLPGISGDNAVDHGIITGLKTADVPSAVEFYDWTTGTSRIFYHLCGIERNRVEARKIAAKIIDYQQQYPGRPVYLIGYSGGAGVAVMALEALPPDHAVTDTILLAPSLARDYDLRLAMSHTVDGIHNFYSRLDVPVLMVLSTALGNSDGRHRLPAGAVGFGVPHSLDKEQRETYERHLIQESYQFAMLKDGHTGGHTGWVVPTFVARHVAPLVGTNAEHPERVEDRLVANHRPATPAKPAVPPGVQPAMYPQSP
jgi:pimeloyl-ACP methyl ester carboxylesterase